MRDWVRKTLDELEAAEGYVMPEASSALDATQLDGKLDANENVFLPREFVLSLAQEATAEIDPRFYPMQEYYELLGTLAVHLDVTPNRIVLGSGGDQLIDLLAKTFLDGGTRAVSITPTYSFYRLRSLLTGAEFVEVPLGSDFSLDVDAILSASSGARVLFLCSPNNPTGNQFAREEIAHLAQKFPGVVVVDEAYFEYAESHVQGLVDKFDNLIVLRTFSKALGLAGMRLGYMIAEPRLAKLFAEKIQYPYPLNSFALKLATKLLQAYDVVRASIEGLKEERERLTRALFWIGVRVFPSQANFLLVEFGERARLIQDSLSAEGIHVKHIGDVLDLKGCLRATIGRPEVNDRLVETVRKFV